MTFLLNLLLPHLELAGLTSRHRITGLWLKIFGLENWLACEGHTTAEPPGCCWGWGRAGMLLVHPLGNVELWSMRKFGCSKPIASFWKMTQPATLSLIFPFLPLGKNPSPS